MQPGRHGIAPNQPATSTRPSASDSTGSAAASGLRAAWRRAQVTWLATDVIRRLGHDVLATVAR